VSPVKVFLKKELNFELCLEDENCQSGAGKEFQVESLSSFSEAEIYILLMGSK
jgi:hypothetical protein